MINLALHYVTAVKIQKKDFGSFKIMEFAFVDRDGKKIYVEAFCETNENPEIVQLPEMNLKS